MINLEKIISLDSKDSRMVGERERIKIFLKKVAMILDLEVKEEEWQSFIIWIYPKKKCLKEFAKNLSICLFYAIPWVFHFFAKNKNLMFYKTLIYMSCVGYFHTSWFVEYKRVCKLGLWSSKGSGLHSPLG